MTCLRNPFVTAIIAICSFATAALLIFVAMFVYDVSNIVIGECTITGHDVVQQEIWPDIDTVEDIWTPTYCVNFYSEVENLTSVLALDSTADGYTSEEQAISSQMNFPINTTHYCLKGSKTQSCDQDGIDSGNIIYLETSAKQLQNEHNYYLFSGVAFLVFGSITLLIGGIEEFCTPYCRCSKRKDYVQFDL
jgi:hypothetical protein